ncbi:TlpA family protein disulfide reductase [Myroides sp. LJL115]
MKISQWIFAGLLLVSGLVYAQEQPMLLFKGTITDLDPEDELEIIFEKNTILPLEVENGKFETRFILPENGASVSIDIMGPKGSRSANFYLGNETVELNASALNFNNELKVEGSSLDSLRYVSHMQTKPIYDKLDALYSDFYSQEQDTANVDSLKSALEENTAVLQKEIGQVRLAFLLDNINTPYGIHLLKYVLPGLDKAQIEALLARVDQKYQDTPEISFATLYAQYPKLELNQRFYDFSVMDQDGKSVDFKDQFDGRYVILDFSHPYCHYCRQAADSIKKLSTELEDKVNLVSVLIDNDKQVLERFKRFRTPNSRIYYAEKADLDPIVAKYKSMDTPTYFVFSPKGELILYQAGIDGDLQGFIENHSKNNPI